jgi:metallo-beta-lactamase family protein
MVNKMKLQFLGATQTVTGAKYLLTIGEKNFLIDCGLFQGLKELRKRNWVELPIAPDKIDAVILTHAHIDHSGYVPLLVKHGFTGRIYATPATRDVCSILLPDSGFLQEEEARMANEHGSSKHHPAVPLYTVKDAKHALQYFYPLNFREEHQLTEDTTLTFSVAGHILGAAGVLIKHAGKSILFSGDLGRLQDPIMYTPDKIHAVDYLVVESTYGNKLHEAVDPQEQLADIINRTMQRGGTLIIPAFAVGRTQIILYHIYRLRQLNLIPNVPIFLDSPLASDATEIFKQHRYEHRLTPEESAAMCSVAHCVDTAVESRLLDTYDVPKILISASGMVVGGRVLHHLHRFLGDGRNTILFCGFQPNGTRGDKLLRGAREIKILGDLIPVNAEVISLSNVSAHADSSEILRWLSTCTSTPQQVFITHGELIAAQTLQEQIEKIFGWQVVIPQYEQIFEL